MVNIINGKGVLRLLLVSVALATLASCKKDDTSGSLWFERPAVYMEDRGRATVRYAGSEIDPASVWVSSSPDGWDVVVDHGAMTLTVTAPEASDEEADMSGTVIIRANSTGGGAAASASLFAGVVGSVDLSDRMANSFLVSRKETHYTFDATRAGDGAPLATASVAVVWQSLSSLVQYLAFENGKASFYVGARSDDAARIKEGNALVGAYDAGGNLIGSWHIWAADYDPEAAEGSVVLNGFRMMSRNLGARASSYASTDDILSSFGLFYQWGRKEPFIGPASYDSAGSKSASMYDGGGRSVYLTTAASDPATGTMDYALTHPLVFITASKDADWLDAAASDGGQRWSTDRKTSCDPCPYGWRVAPAAAYAGLSIADDLAGDNAALAELYRDRYAWTLTDGRAESLFFGAGRRSYRNGSLQNYYDDSLPVRSAALEMQPWVGYYWTAEAAEAFCFWFLLDDVAASGVRSRTMGAANGMQVRCVAVE